MTELVDALRRLGGLPGDGEGARALLASTRWPDHTQLTIAVPGNEYLSAIDFVRFVAQEERDGVCWLATGYAEDSECEIGVQSDAPDGPLVLRPLSDSSPVAHYLAGDGVAHVELAMTLDSFVRSLARQGLHPETIGQIERLGGTFEPVRMEPGSDEARKARYETWLCDDAVEFLERVRWPASARYRGTFGDWELRLVRFGHLVLHELAGAEWVCIGEADGGNYQLLTSGGSEVAGVYVKDHVDPGVSFVASLRDVLAGLRLEDG